MDNEIIDLIDDSDSQNASNLSPEIYSVISISEDEDDTINDLISKIDKGKFSVDMIQSCQEILAKLDEKLRNEETIKILLTQMKLTQEKYKSLTERNNVDSTIKNNDFHDHSDCVNITTKPYFDNDIACVNLDNDETDNYFLGSFAFKAGSKNTNIQIAQNIAIQALDIQYETNKSLIRKITDTSLTQIFLTKSTCSALRGKNKASNVNSNDFMALYGLEEVVESLQKCHERYAEERCVNMKVLFRPCKCIQCGNKISPKLLNGRLIDGSIVCECCSYDIYHNQAPIDYRDKVRQILQNAIVQETALDRDYKAVIEDPMKMQLYKQSQGIKLPFVDHNNKHKTFTKFVNIQPKFGPRLATTDHTSPVRNQLWKSIQIPVDILKRPVPNEPKEQDTTKHDLYARQFLALYKLDASNSINTTTNTAKSQERESRSKMLQKQNQETLNTIMRSEHRKKSFENSLGNEMETEIVEEISKDQRKNTEIDSQR